MCLGLPALPMSPPTFGREDLPGAMLRPHRAILTAQLRNELAKTQTIAPAKPVAPLASFHSCPVLLADAPANDKASAHGALDPEMCSAFTDLLTLLELLVRLLDVFYEALKP